MKVIIADGKGKLNIGRQTDNERTTVVFPLADLLEEFPGGGATLKIRRPHENEFYVSETTSTDGTNLLWLVQDYDVAIEGDGEVQLYYTVDDVAAPGRIFKTYSDRSLTDQAAELPGWSSWKDDLIAAGNVIQAAIIAYNEMTAVAEQLPAGSSPTAEIIDNVLHLGIPAGATGATGPAGADGQDGQDGAPGQDGRDGRDGSDGRDGRDGVDGQDGADGLDGQDGQDGQDGNGISDISWTGDRLTITLDDGQSATSPSLTGPQGPAGIQGPQGPAGADGTTAIDDSSTAANKTWSSQKISSELSQQSETIVNLNSALNPLMPYKVYHANEKGNVFFHAEDIITDGVYYIDSVSGKITTDMSDGWEGYCGYKIKVEANTDYAFTNGRYVYFASADKATPVAERVQRVTTVNSGDAEYLVINFNYETYPRSSYIFGKGTVPEAVGEYCVSYDWLDFGTIEASKLQGAVSSGNLIGDAFNWLTESRWMPDSQTGKLSISSLSGYTGFLIEVDHNTDYAFTYGRYVYLVDSDKSTIIGSALQRVTTVNSGTASYIAICFSYGTYPVNSYVFCKGTNIVGKSNVLYTLPWLNIEDGLIPVYSQNTLHGKKWVVIGDSFTAGVTTTKIQNGIYAGKNYSYPWLIGNKNSMNVVQFFDGGRTLAFPATPGDFSNSITNPSADWYYQNIPADADYITIYLGINDDHHRTGGGDDEDPTGYIPLGTVDDNTTESYLGAWNVVLTWLITNRPNAHIGIIVTNGIASNDDYRLGQIAIAKKYGIPYLDLNGDGRTPAMLRTSNPDMSSAVKTALIQKWAVNPGVNDHPNDSAHLFESYVIEEFLRNI